MILFGNSTLVSFEQSAKVPFCKADKFCPHVSVVNAVQFANAYDPNVCTEIGISKFTSVVHL